MPENDAKPPLDLADIEDPPEAVGFEFETTALGTLTCPRIKVVHLMRLVRIVGDVRSISPSQAARALLQAAVAKADGSEVSEAEANALTPEELEDFADRAVRAGHGTGGPNCSRPPNPPRSSCSNTLRGLTEFSVGPLASTTGLIMGGIGAFKDRLAATAVRAAGSPLLAPRCVGRHRARHARRAPTVGSPAAPSRARPR
ncbi:hypothetical protein CTI14_06220 [Methylobacterium radiotolerans]|nr:hypothetical protein CTI14_06220 [Methylobacterium radiotolerans]